MPAAVGLAGARLSRPVKLLYGFGLSCEGIKTNAFNMFLLFYYQQVAGLDPLLAGVALFVALCVDAVTDPAVGIWSDATRSRLGRRHPFMYASSLPLAVCFVAVFHPPSGASQAVLFAWLTIFAVGTRFSMTLFAIPHQSLVAELSRDYDERTKLQSGRTVFAWLFGLMNVLLAYTVFLRATAESPYDPTGFGPFALWGGCVMLFATLVSSLGTQRAALTVAQPDVTHVRVRDLFKELRAAFASTNYRATVVAGLLGAVAFGLSENMQNYMNLFFWGFTAQQLAIFIVVIAITSILVMVMAPRLAGRFSKARVAVWGSLITACVTPTMVTLKLLGVLPESGSPALLRVLCVAVFVGYSATITTIIMVGSMIADITDEHEHRLGTRQEGLLYSGLTLIAKAASGLAPVVAGAVIKLADFPRNARPDSVDPATVQKLGVFVALFTLTFGLLAAWAYSRYRLSRERHAEILTDLVARRASVS